VSTPRAGRTACRRTAAGTKVARLRACAAVDDDLACAVRVWIAGRGPAAGRAAATEDRWAVGRRTVSTGLAATGFLATAGLAGTGLATAVFAAAGLAVAGLAVAGLAGVALAAAVLTAGNLAATAGFAAARRRTSAGRRIAAGRTAAAGRAARTGRVAAARERVAGRSATLVLTLAGAAARRGATSLPTGREAATACTWGRTTGARRTLTADTIEGS
jgi:hypothetical protein